jgi:cytosine/creatinine deaminase
MEPLVSPAVSPALDAHGMLAVALEQARIGFAEGGVPVGGAIFRTDGTLLGVGHNRLVQEGNCSLHGETDAFRAAGRRPTSQVIVGDSVNAQGGTKWLREQGIDIVDLHSEECIDLIAKFQRMCPDLWKECIGEA